MYADHGRRHVLAVALDSGPTSVIAGNGTQRAAGDGTDARNASLYAPAGMAFAEDGTLLFADRLNHLIRRVDPDGTIHSVEGLQLQEPEDVVVDAEGRIFVADTGNDRVFRLEPAGGGVDIVAGLAPQSLR
jgi:serine/threonine-protein kinase